MAVGKEKDKKKKKKMLYPRTIFNLVLTSLMSRFNSQTLYISIPEFLNSISALARYFIYHRSSAI